MILIDILIEFFGVALLFCGLEPKLAGPILHTTISSGDQVAFIVCGVFLILLGFVAGLFSTIDSQR